nr:MAG TPA: hypothetical protein [Caudoviricetes sp.]
MKVIIFFIPRSVLIILFRPLIYLSLDNNRGKFI